jgi:hypothetical protein
MAMKVEKIKWRRKATILVKGQTKTLEASVVLGCD